jgi:hypothetical protein
LWWLVAAVLVLMVVVAALEVCEQDQVSLSFRA